MQRFPTVVSEPSLSVDVYARVEHKELWALMLKLPTSLVLFGFGGIVG
jgi:hypothetical protein